MFRSFVTAAALALATLIATPVWAAIDVNKASQAELEALPGVGPTLSGRILAERDKSPFKDWPDLIERVRGVGAGSAAKLSGGGLTVGSATYVPVADTPRRDRPARTPKADQAAKADKAPKAAR